MALSMVVDATAHAALSEAHRGLYVAGEGGSFKLDTTGGVDVSKLETALASQREEVRLGKVASKKALEDALAPFAGIDPVATRAMFAKFESTDEAALIAAGKLDEVITKRMEKHNVAQQKLIGAANTERDDARKESSDLKQGALDSLIRAAAAKAGIHTGAIDDALLRARGLFSLKGVGEAVQFDEDGKTVVLGKDGKTPFSPEEWLEAMKESAPHWFPASASGGGAGGGGKGTGSGKTMKRAAFMMLDPVAKAAAMKDKIAVID